MVALTGWRKHSRVRGNAMPLRRQENAMLFPSFPESLIGLCIYNVDTNGVGI